MLGGGVRFGVGSVESVMSVTGLMVESVAGRRRRACCRSLTTSSKVGASAKEGGMPREGAGEGWWSASALGAVVRTPGDGVGKNSIGFWRGVRLRNVLLSFDRDDFSAFRGVELGLGVGWGEGSLPSSFSPSFTLLLLGVSFGAGAGAPGGR